ncbi:pyridoxal phosphate-dependent transferase [Thelonectria olida]|uniref:Pyridoxal phosphate-dependent transferase n=1 Tax=Thelonectria olida TaxID=1576542 RepID=A0A9P8VVR7_9HYPO|nr:pyridoxal phosphate-dependent transferase [Thelonectria olida]
MRYDFWARDCSRIFCGPGDTVLIESHAYSGTLACARSQGIQLRSVGLDGQGLVPADLDQTLSTWDPAKGPKPFVLYMIPTGQNPTGTTQSLERRNEIYQLAEKHDLYILEDDPYYFIDLTTNTSDDQPTDPHHSDLSDLDEYLSHLPSSYMSLDVSGRVLRLDSTSKILAPGLRAGWVTASSGVIEKFVSLSEVGALHPSGPTQVMLYKLLDKTWGHEGFIRWLMNLSDQYRRRRNVLVAACVKHLPSDACVWRVPELGMFFWIELDLSKLGSLAQAPCAEKSWKTYLDAEEAIFAQAQENGVLVSRGSWFMNNVQELRAVNFRMTFAAAQEDSLERAVERFGRAICQQLEKTEQSEATLSEVVENSAKSKTGILTEIRLELNV